MTYGLEISTRLQLIPVPQRSLTWPSNNLQICQQKIPAPEIATLPAIKEME